MSVIDRKISTAITSLGAGTAASVAAAIYAGYGVTTPTAISAAGNTDLGIVAGNFMRLFNVSATAGGGAYTATVTLLAANATAGCVATVSIALPASVNPTIEVRNLTAAGTLLGTALSTGDARTVTFTAVFDGTNWALRAKMPAHVTAMESGLAVRRRTLSGNLTLTQNDKSVQSLVLDADRDGTLPAEGADPWQFLWRNSGANYNLTVKRSGGTAVGVLIPGSSLLVTWDGTAVLVS